MDHEHNELEEYGDERIASKDALVPFWLKFNYVFWAVFGLIWGYLFWNGSYGWLDRGYWQQLQRAANTTYPFDVSEQLESLPSEQHVSTTPLSCSVGFKERQKR